MKKPTEPEKPSLKITIHGSENVREGHTGKDIQDAFNILKNRIKLKHDINIKFSEIVVETDDIESGYDSDGEFQEYCPNGLMTVEFTKEFPNENYEKDLQNYIALNEKYKKDLIEYDNYVKFRESEYIRSQEEYKQREIERIKNKHKKREDKLLAKYGEDWRNIVKDIAAEKIKNRSSR